MSVIYGTGRTGSSLHSVRSVPIEESCSYRTKRSCLGQRSCVWAQQMGQNLLVLLYMQLETSDHEDATTDRSLPVFVSLLVVVSFFVVVVFGSVRFDESSFKDSS